MVDNKIVVFDLDETLGYFTQVCILWESLELYVKHNNCEIELSQDFFDKLLDLFPEYIRPNIESILNYLSKKKTQNHCKHVMIYTNNQRQKKWVFMIKKYFENKIKFDLFDQIICAFKINGKHIELCRTTHNKTHKDLIKCTKIPTNTEICFIDDTYFPEMHSTDIYYIKLKPYTFCLHENIIITRFVSSDLFKLFMKHCKEKVDSEEFREFLKCRFDQIEKKRKIKSMKEYEIDKIITKQIMQHLEIFFDKKKSSPPNFDNMVKTKKHRHYKNKTQKVRN